MARNFSIQGDVSGKLGEMVGYKLFGAARARKYDPRHKDPRSDAQLLVRARFAVLAQTMRAFKSAFKLGLATMAKSGHMHPCNAFVQLNQQALSGTDPESVTLDLSKVQVANGVLPQVTFGTASFDEAHTVTVSFQSNSEVTTAKDDDLVYLFIYSQDWNQGVLSAPAKRSVKSVSVGVPGTWSGLEVHVYGFVVNGAGETSDSMYVGSGTLA